VLDLGRPRVGLEPHHVEEPHRTELARRDLDGSEALFADALLRVRAHVHVVDLALLLVRRDIEAAHEQAQRRGDVGDVHAEIRGARPIDSHLELRLAAEERGLHVDRAGDRAQLVGHERRLARELVEVRPADHVLDERVLRAASAAHHRDLVDVDAEVLGLLRDELTHARHQLLLRELAALGLDDRPRP
jgi:hypothetical protein